MTRFALAGKCGGFTAMASPAGALGGEGPLLGQEPAQAQRAQAQRGALQEGLGGSGDGPGGRSRMGFVPVVNRRTSTRWP